MIQFCDFMCKFTFTPFIFAVSNLVNSSTVIAFNQMFEVEVYNNQFFCHRT